MLGRRAWLALPAVFLAAFLAVPVAGLLAQLTPDGLAWLAQPYASHRILGAVEQALLSLLLAAAFAFPLVLLHRRGVAGSRWMLALHAAPFVMPVFVVVFGLEATLGPTGWLAALGGPDVIGALGPLGAVALANAFYNYGFAARLATITLDARPRRLEEAAAVLGAPPRAVWRRVTGPLLAPAFAALALLVLLFCLGSFGVVFLLGQGHVDTLETLLYANRAGAFPRLDRSAALAVAQLALNGTLLFLALRWQRRLRLPAESAPRGGAIQPVRTSVAAMFAFASTLPLVAVLVGGFRLRGSWSLAPWRTLLDAAAPGHLVGFDLATALGWTLLYAATSALLALLLALALAYGLRRLGGLRRAAEWLAALPLAASSLTLGYGLAAAYGAGLAVAGAMLLPAHSPLLVVAAHTVLAFPLAARVVVPAVDRLDVRGEEAAAVLGARPAAQWRRVHLPALLPALLGAASLSAAASLGDFGASLLVAPGDALGLTVWVARHGGTGSFDPLARAQSTALAGLLLVLTLGLLSLLSPRRRAA